MINRLTILATPTFQVGLTPEEKSLYSRLFKSLDTNGTHVISGDKARSTFEKSGLLPSVLGEIWQIADQNNLGILTQFGFCQAMRLIGYAQSGKHPSASLAEHPGPLPRFALNGQSTQVPYILSQNTNGSFNSQPSSTIPPSTTYQSAPIGALSPIDYQKFSQLYIRTVGSPDNVLNGSKAKEIFLKAKLPTPVLGQVWSLVDKDNAGQLNLNEFVVAMHLIQGLISGTIKQLPPSIPENMWTSVQTMRAQNSMRQTSLGSVSSQETAIRHNKQTQDSQGANNNEWIVTPSLKQQYESIFKSLDKSKSGVLDSSSVASFLMTSKLSQQDLASIWDLSDIQNTGNFLILEFSIALFLVNKKLAGEELPSIVPASLIESLKPDALVQTPSGSKELQGKENLTMLPPNTSQSLGRSKSSMSDLFDIFDGGKSGTSNEKRLPSWSSNLSDPSKNGKSVPNTFKPTSSFGQQLMGSPGSALKEENESGASKAVPQNDRHPSIQPPQQVPSPLPRQRGINYDALRTAPSPPGISPTKTEPNMAVPNLDNGSRNDPSKESSVPQNYNEDLLADNNPEISGGLSQATSDIANLSNQVKSLTTQTTSLYDKKTKAEDELSRTLKNRQDIETKLKTLRSSYESDAERHRIVEKDLAAAKEEYNALKSESSIAEAKVNYLLRQLNESQVAFEQMQKENSALKEKLGNLNAENLELEKQFEQKKAENNAWRNKLAVQRSQLQVSVVKNRELKDQIIQEETSTREIAQEEKKNEELLDLQGKEKEPLDSFGDQSSRQEKLLSEKGALGAAVGGVISGAAGITSHFMNNPQQKDTDNKSYESSLIGESKQLSADESGREFTDSANEEPESHNFSVNVDSLVAEEKPDNENSDADKETLTTNQTGILSANRNNIGTPVTSLSNSDVNLPNASGMPGSMAGVTTLNIQRNDSLSSSVQNNALLSVRDDNIDDINDRETAPREDTFRNAENDESVRGLKQGLKEESAESDRGLSGVESFEMVNPEEVASNEPGYNSQSKLQKDVDYSSGKVRSDKLKNSIEEEFPPIRELDYGDDSSIDESKTDSFDDAYDNLPASHGGIGKQFPEVQGQDDAFGSEPGAVSNNAEDDIFGNEFDNLETAKVENNVNEDFEDRGEDIGLSNDFTNENTFGRSEFPDFGSSTGVSQNEGQNTNDEWEQLFAGFGNSSASPADAGIVKSDKSEPSLASGKDTAVQELLGMGFDKKTSIDALEKNNWDLDGAINYVLDNA